MIGERRRASRHRVLGALESAHTRHSRLEINGEPLYHPARLVLIRKEQRIPAEDRLAEAPDPARAVEMKNVRELVGHHERIPVIVVAEPGGIGGRARENDDAIRWE